MADKNTTNSVNTKEPKRIDSSHPTAQGNTSDGSGTTMPPTTGTPATKGDSTTGSGIESKTKGKDEEKHAHINELSKMDRESYPPVEAGEVSQALKDIIQIWKNKKDKTK